MDIRRRLWEKNQYQRADDPQRRDGSCDDQQELFVQRSLAGLFAADPAQLLLVRREVINGVPG